VRRSGISDEEIENAVKEYFYDQTIDPNLLDYFSERSLEKMERAVEKYENSEKKVFSKQGIITEEVVE
jgi:hypothetical protein